MSDPWWVTSVTRSRVIVDRQPLLFGAQEEGAVPVLEDGRLVLDAGFLDRGTADRLFADLLDGVDWRQEQISMYGRSVDVPRLTSWHGDAGRAYMYSGISMDPLPWTPDLEEIRGLVERASEARFNAVLLNLYRDGSDSVAWHADDEPELGEAPVIASVSLGATRTFQLKHKRRKDVPRVDLDLAHGSLLVMHPPTQAHWLHAVPKRRRPIGPRINLTFRHILP